jgi:ribose transport system substrate-binding protein
VKNKSMLITTLAGVMLAASLSPLAISSANAATPKFKSRETRLPVGFDKPAKNQKLQLAYLNPFGGNEFLDAMGTAMKKATTKLGGTLTILDGKGDVNLQVSQVQQLTAQKIDGIFVFALDPNSMKPALAEAAAAGIKLISIDENFKNNKIGVYDSQIMQRRDEAAYLGAKHMASLIGTGSSYATMDFAIAVPSIVYSIDRAKKWANSFGLMWEGNASNPSDDIAGGTTAGTQLLSNYPSIKGIIAYNDPSAIGANSAGKAANVTGVTYGGQNGGSDARAGIKSGNLSYTIQLAAPSIGQFAAWGLYNANQGKKLPKTVRAEAPVLVTAKNMKSVPSWAKELKSK